MHPGSSKKSEVCTLFCRISVHKAVIIFTNLDTKWMRIEGWFTEIILENIYNIIVKKLRNNNIKRDMGITRYRYLEKDQIFQTSHLELSKCSFHQRSRPLGTNLRHSFRVLTLFRWILRLSQIRFLHNDNEVYRLNVSVLRQIKIFIATKVTVILRERTLTNYSVNVIIVYA